MRLRWAYVAAFGLPLVAMLSLGATAPDELEGVRNFSFDAYQRIRPRAWSPDTPVRIVDIDDESLGRLGQWPWPRARLGAVVKAASDLGAATIAFDMAFAEPDRLSPEFFTRDLDAQTRTRVEGAMAGVESYDAQFAREISKATVVLGAIMTNNGSPGVSAPVKAGFAYAGDDPTPWLADFSAIAAPLPQLAGPAAGIGVLNWLPGHDQIVREAPLIVRSGTTLVPSLALEALRTAQGASTIIVRSSNASGQTAFGAATGVNAIKVGDVALATGPHAERRIYFSRSQRGRFIPAWKLLAGAIPREEIEGRIILVGSSAAGVLDQRATPLDSVAPGVEIHAQLIEHALAGGDLVRPDWAAPAELAAALILSLIAALAASVVRPFVGALIGVVAIAAMFGFGWEAFATQGVLIDPIFPSATVVVAYLAGLIELFRFERTQKAQVKNAFGRFVSPEIVERLASSPDRLTLGGESRALTLMFCDMRDYTGLVEGLDAAETISFMNDYLTPLTDTVLAHGGTVDKYMGDAIMAFWNAPLDDPAHARNACLTALAMRAALAGFNASRATLDETKRRAHRDARFGIGLNTGLCSVGNIGSVKRFDYSAIGDPVNVASRLEGLTKLYGVDILASEETQGEASDLAWLEVDCVRVKGREAPTRLFALIGDGSVERDPAFGELRGRHEAMIATYRARRFDESAAAAERLAVERDDLAPLYRAFAELAREAATLPEGVWSAVRTLDSK
ncbi:MAG: adenylate/guanylate cyclase domain-containing protein [Methylobacteriaceae bacterium]|nr:adenylate/guanylate cyclase domain-containing protein [Methylobacteriaceae bacterium]